MKGLKARLCPASGVAMAGLALLFCTAGLTACGGGKGPTAAAASAEKAAIGKTIKAGDWEVTLSGASEKLKIVGKAEITYQAQGTYVIVPVKVKNMGTAMQLLPSTDIELRDAQGRKFPATVSAVQVAYALPRGMGLLLDSPVEAGASRESIIIFDVPPDATQLQLALKGTEDRLDLGF